MHKQQQQQQQMSEISIINGYSSLSTATSSTAKTFIGEIISAMIALINKAIVFLDTADPRKNNLEGLLQKLQNNPSEYSMKTNTKEVIKKLTAILNTSKDESKKEELRKLLKEAQDILGLCNSRDKDNAITAKASKAAVTSASVKPASVKSASKAAVTLASKAAVPKVNATSVRASKDTLQLSLDQEMVNSYSRTLLFIERLTEDQCSIIQQKLLEKRISEILTFEKIKATFGQIKNLSSKARNDSRESLILILNFCSSLPTVLELIFNSTGSIIILFNELMEVTKDCEEMRKKIIYIFKELKIYNLPNQVSIKDESDSDDSDSDDSELDKETGEHSTFENQENPLSKDKKDQIK